MTAYPAERYIATMLAKLLHHLNPPLVFRCIVIGIAIRTLTSFAFLIYLLYTYSEVREDLLPFVWRSIAPALIFSIFLLPAFYGVFTPLGKCHANYVKYICFFAACVIFNIISSFLPLKEIAEGWADGFDRTPRAFIRAFPSFLWLACIIFLYKKIWPYFLKKPVDFAVTDQ